MAFKVNAASLERRIITLIAVGILLVVVAGFAGVLLAHQNTLAIVDSVVRWIWPSATAAEIMRIHRLSRKFGHFLIPAGAFAVLVVGPWRQRPLMALALCALFAGTDEFLQVFSPERTGSILDVLLDTSGAVFAYFAYCAIPASRRIAPVPARRVRRPIAR